MLIALGLTFTGPTFPKSTHLVGWVTLGKYLNSIAKEGDTLATDAAGAIAYYSKLPTYDILGLNDTYIAHKEVESIGTGAPGHEKQDNQYILNKKPSFITTWIDSDGGAGRGFKEYIDFIMNYELIALLDTSSDKECINRIKLINSNIPRSEIIKIRNDSKGGVYDWALYKRTENINKNNIRLKMHQFKIDWRNDAHVIVNEDNISVNKDIKKQGYLFYGPYFKINKGKYKISFYIRAKNIVNEQIGNFDIAYGGIIISEKGINISNSNENKKIELSFIINQYNEDKPIEFRFYYFTNADIQISNFTLERML